MPFDTEKAPRSRRGPINPPADTPPGVEKTPPPQRELKWLEIREHLAEAAQVDGLAAWRLDGLVWNALFEKRP